MDPYGPCFELEYDQSLGPDDVCPGANICNRWGSMHPDNCYRLGKCSYTCGDALDCPVPTTGEASVECVNDFCRLFCDECLLCPDGMICADSPFIPDDRPECVWLATPAGCDFEGVPDVPGPCPT